jgi:hypothetical protein
MGKTDFLEIASSHKPLLAMTSGDFKKALKWLRAAIDVSHWSD